MWSVEGTIWGTRHKVMICSLGSNRNGTDLLVGHICTVVCVYRILQSRMVILAPGCGPGSEPRCNSCIRARRGDHFVFCTETIHRRTQQMAPHTDTGGECVHNNNLQHYKWSKFAFWSEAAAPELWPKSTG